MASAYATYEYYTRTYHGTLSEDEYNAAVVKATQIIVNMTGGRKASDMEDALKMCECEIADAVSSSSQLPDGVQSVNNDGYSMTFSSRVDMEDAFARICKTWLTFPTNLMLGWL